MKNNLIYKLNDAVLKGINESFDMDDLGNEIVADHVEKSHVVKHSKLYNGLQRFINAGYNLDKRLKGQVDDYADVFCGIFGNIRDLDDETNELLKKLTFDQKRSLWWFFVGIPKLVSIVQNSEPI